MARKVGEEGVEVALASLKDQTDQLTDETADLLYHLLVLLYRKNLSLGEVKDALRESKK